MDDPSRAHLFGRLSLVEAAVRATVGPRRAVDPQPDDAFRGLYVSDDHVDRLLEEGRPLFSQVPDAAERLAALEAEADEWEAAGHDLRLRGLARAAGLGPPDVGLLLVALAPDLDARFEKLYGYLNDDVTRRRATVGLAIELAGSSPLDAGVRTRLQAGAPLVDGGFLEVDEPERPFLSRSLRVPDRVCWHLLGSDATAPELLHLLADVVPASGAPAPEAAAVARALGAGARLVHLAEKPGSASRTTAVDALRLAGFDAVVLDLHRLGPEEDLRELARAAGREARLRGAGLVAGPLEVLTNADASVAGAKGRPTAGVRHLAELQCPTILHSRGTWDPQWSRSVAVLSDAQPLAAEERERAWRTAMALDGAIDGGVDAAEATAHFRLPPEGIARATASAVQQASLHGGAVAFDDLRAGARAQNAAGLEHLARRIDPRVGWNDLVLPPLTMSHLRELAARAARNRETVLDRWQLRPGGGRGRGIAALFAGDSGTGKTMSAEVVAHALGLDLYTVNLATVVDKYVGETEKNLERIFAEADGVNGIILFDEADALFGKRSDVKDAHDRYANIEVAYLLQRMETFDGLAILSTNLRANVDEAFARRLDSIVDFPMPDADHRVLLWERCLGAAVPRGDDLDLRFLAEQFELAGGNIRSIALTAAYLAAESGAPVSMADLIRATAREYRKLGRLVVDREFGPYHHLVRAETSGA